MTFFVKGRPKSARQSRDSTVAARRAQSVTVPSSRVSRECRSPGLKSPPLKMLDHSKYEIVLSLFRDWGGVSEMLSFSQGVKGCVRVCFAARGLE